MGASRVMHTVSIDTPYGTVTATWVRKGRMIVIRYGEREKKEVASDHDVTNDITARSVLRRWIAEDLQDD
jgi:hypothetical protein